MIIEINSKEEFEEKILKNENRVIVDFFATWCGPCKMQSPILDSMKDENANIEIFKVDIDKNKDLALEYNIMSVPTLMIFENGMKINEVLGLHNKEDLLNLYNM